MSFEAEDCLDCIICFQSKEKSEILKCHICRTFFCLACRLKLPIGLRQCVKCKDVIGHFCSVYCQVVDKFNLSNNRAISMCQFCTGSTTQRSTCALQAYEEE